MAEEKQDVVLSTEERIKGFLEKIRRQDPLRMELWEHLMESFVMRKPTHDEHYAELSRQKDNLDEIMAAQAKSGDNSAKLSQEIADLKKIIADMQAKLKGAVGGGKPGSEGGLD